MILLPFDRDISKLPISLARTKQAGCMTMLIRCFQMTCDQGYAGQFVLTAIPITWRAMVRASIQFLDARFHHEIQYFLGYA
jgi:hypothetical protein